jgi:hypothetical protein
MAIPGERFRESYYWDSLWILKGLVASKMWTSAANLVQNMLFLVEAHGLVPNGCRVCLANAGHCVFFTSICCYANLIATMLSSGLLGSLFRGERLPSSGHGDFLGASHTKVDPVASALAMPWQRRPLQVTHM